MRETSYGFLRRFEFAAGALRERKARSVLDLGCGTGLNLLIPLARSFPDVRFVGVDTDAASIGVARETRQTNVELHLASEWPASERFDLVIASEVIEHVESPPAFLGQAAARVAEGGRLLLTLPNGFGSAEWASLTAAALKLSGIYGLLRSVKRTVVAKPPPTEAMRDSCAASPHINFLSYPAILRLIREAGLTVVAYKPRSLLCGFGWDLLLRGERLTRWNQSVVDRLPAVFAADWMFLLEPNGAPAPAPYRRGAYARLQRWANEKSALRG